MLVTAKLLFFSKVVNPLESLYNLLLLSSAEISYSSDSPHINPLHVVLSHGLQLGPGPGLGLCPGHGPGLTTGPGPGPGPDPGPGPGPGPDQGPCPDPDTDPVIDLYCPPS